MIGKTISHYKILEKLGSGGMGTVYKAKDTKLDRFVALKFLPPHLSQAEEEEKRFIHEAKAASALDHPNICSIYEINETKEGQLFIVMACYEGESLKEKIKNQKLKIKEAIDIAIQIAQGLNKAHKKSIVHRDIKPANILVTEDGVVKIVDFGLAKLAGQTKLTKTGSTLGTVTYMSPEQAQSAEVDHRSDIWSLGVILYEMLIGQPPFTGAYEQAVIYSILNEQPKPVNELLSEIPETLGQIVSRALEKDPEKRYQHVRELLDDLEALSAGIVPEEIKTRMRKAKLRKRRKAILYSMTAGLLIVVVAVLIFMTRQAQAIDSIAVLPMENLTGNADQQYFVDGVTDALIGQLGQISGLHRVISRTSMMRYKDTDKSLSEIAQELHVDALVEGTVYQIGENISIKLQLFNALPEERSLWAQRYDRPVTDVLVMYAEMASSIADNIQVKLTVDETSRFAGARQVNPESYDAYLKGLPHLNKLTPEGIKIAQQYFDLALEIDPNNALAHAGVSLVWGHRYQMGIAPRQEALPLAKAAIEKAMELDNTLAEAHWALGGIKCWSEWDWEGAEKEFQQACRLNPNNAGAHGAYSQLLCHLGRIDEAFPHIELALELDPLNPMWHLFYGVILSHHRRYDDAIAAYRAALDIAPNYPIALGNLADALGEKGMCDEELAIWRRIYADDTELTMALEEGFEKAGYKGAYRALADLKADWYGNPGKSIAAKEIAYDYNKAGDYDLAIDWYEKAYEEHDPNLPYIRMLGNHLRSHPRFQELLRKMNLPVEDMK